MYIEHKPVLINEAINLLNIKKNGIYVDATLGGGGYAQAILTRLSSGGKLIAIDCDAEAIENFRNKFRNYKNVILIKNNFRNIEKVLSNLDINKIDGIVFDLGVSTHQLFCGARGFSFRTSSPLDMRMDLGLSANAKDLVNELSKEELSKIFTEFGEEKFSKLIAKNIVAQRASKKINTTNDLVEVIKKSVPLKFQKKQKIHFATRIFQSLRIAVNSELSSLEKALEVSVKLLNKGGRVVVVSYHSLEDRIVKNIFRQNIGKCVCDAKLPECRCGAKKILEILIRKPVIPSEEEIKLNPRSRSARLRAAEKKE